MESLARAANRGSVSTGYNIDNSLKLEPDNSEFLSITNTSDGSNRTATYSFWLKRTELDASSYMQVPGLFNSGETVRFMFYQDHIILENGWGGTQKRLTTNAVYRDTSAFYHFVVGIDTTQSTAANRVKLYVNGVQETSFSTEQYPDQNFDLAIGRSGANYPWRYGGYNATYYKTAGYLAEAHYIDGTQYAASDFGEFDNDSGIWKPKEFTGNYGTQGSYLNFSDASNLGANPKGSGIDAVLNNITSADQATDSPTNNFCTLNMLHRTDGNSKNQEGATNVTTDGGSDWCTMMGTIGVTKGKWYWEYFKTTSGGANIYFGIAASDDPWVPHSSAAKYYIGNVAEQTSIGFKVADNSIANGNSSNVFALLSGEVLRVALDMDNGALYFGKSSSTWANSGDPTSGASKTGASTLWSSFDDKIVLPGISVYQGGDAKSNFGGYASYTISSGASDANGYGTFEYAPPSGYYALCTKNLEEFG